MTALFTAVAVTAVVVLTGWVVRAMVQRHRAIAVTHATAEYRPLMQRIKRADPVTPEYVENGIRDLQRWLAEQRSAR